VRNRAKVRLITGGFDIPGIKAKEPSPTGAEGAPVPPLKNRPVTSRARKKARPKAGRPPLRQAGGAVTTATQIAGVLIPSSLLGVVRARKSIETDGHWVLSTRKGTVIATFATQDDLDSWWKDFQSSQGRVATQVTVEGISKLRARRRRPKRQPAENTNMQLDYLKPLSAEYNMPEYDLE
jgi:hypothetical protein